MTISASRSGAFGAADAASQAPAILSASVSEQRLAGCVKRAANPSSGYIDAIALSLSRRPAWQLRRYVRRALHAPFVRWFVVGQSPGSSEGCATIAEAVLRASCCQLAGSSKRPAATATAGQRQLQRSFRRPPLCRTVLLPPTTVLPEPLTAVHLLIAGHRSVAVSVRHGVGGAQLQLGHYLCAGLGSQRLLQPEPVLRPARAQPLPGLQEAVAQQAAEHPQQLPAGGAHRHDLPQVPPGAPLTPGERFSEVSALTFSDLFCAIVIERHMVAVRCWQPVVEPHKSGARACFSCATVTAWGSGSLPV